MPAYDLKKQKGFLQRITKMTPPQILTSGFFLLIVLGGILLHLPIADKKPISWMDAFFTATSAMTVTGLWVVDTGSSYTLFGQIVILALVQTGGLGFLTFAAFIFLILGNQVGLKERIIIQEELQTPIGRIMKLVKRLMLYSFIIEGIGVVLLAIHWIPHMGFWQGLYYSIFHIIAAFNNAGFTLWQNNLTQFVGDPVVNLVITSMIIIGGLGFTVLHDIWHSKSFQKLTLHSKIMIAGTILLNVIAILVVFLLEYKNPHTLRHLTTDEKWWAAYFQGITPRTAGFNTIPIGDLREATLLFMMMLMFIGAGSVSTGSGIKLTTFVVIVLAVNTFLRKKKQSAIIFGRRISEKVVHRALAITITSLTFLFFAVFALTITQPIPFMKLLFETVSAFGTGLSTGITTNLNGFGKLIIMFVMFIGLVGPLSVVLSISQGEKEKVRYPPEDVFTG